MEPFLRDSPPSAYRCSRALGIAKCRLIRAKQLRARQVLVKDAVRNRKHLRHIAVTI